MTTINQLNTLLRTANNNLKLTDLDNAYSRFTDNYIKSNLTLLGHKAGETLAGFTALSQERDYAKLLISGTTPVLFHEDPLLENSISGLMVSTEDVSVEVNDFDFQLNEDNTEGADLDYESQLSNQLLSTILAFNTGLVESGPKNMHRIVSTGGPGAALNVINSIDGYVGPWKKLNVYKDAVTGDEESLDDLFDTIRVTDGNLVEIADILSPLTNTPSPSEIESELTTTTQDETSPLNVPGTPRRHVKGATITKAEWSGKRTITQLITIPRGLPLVTPFTTSSSSNAYGVIRHSVPTGRTTPRTRLWISAAPAGPAVSRKYDQEFAFIGSMNWQGFSANGEPQLLPNTTYYLNIEHTQVSAAPSSVQRNISNLRG